MAELGLTAGKKVALTLDFSGEYLGTVEIEGTVRNVAIAMHEGNMLTFDKYSGKGIESSEGYCVHVPKEPNLELIHEIVKNLAHGAASDTVSDSHFRSTAAIALQNILNEFTP